MILRTQGGMLAAAAVLTSTGRPALTACAQVDASTSGVTRVVKVFEYTN